jgi:chromosome segregation ATPase
MEEGKLDAIVDEAPWVEIERPGIDLVVSTPVKVPIFLRASDDYGITQIELAVQKGEEEAFQGRPVESFDQPPRSVTQVVTLDLAEEALAVGASLKYRIVVRDGKGSSATSRDYTIRLADESKAADKQFEQYETQTDTFREKLVKLIAEQDKIRESTEQLVEKYEPLTEKLEAAAAEAKQDVDPADPQAKPAPLKLDEETTKQRDELRGELTQLAAQENKNVELGKQVANDLKQLAEQANNQAFLPPEITRQLEAMQEAFEDLAVEPMQQLANQAQAAAQPQEENPPLENIQQQSEEVQKNLDDLQNRLEALADAQTESRTDAETALADLRRELMQQDAQLTASDLAELRDFLEAKRADLDTLQGSQEELLEDATKDLSERGFEAIEEEQTQLDVDSDEELDSVRDLLEQLREMKDPPEFPGRPYDPEQEGYKVPPKEQDTAEPEDGKKQAEQAPEPDGEAGEGETEEEDPELFLPALGGPVPEMDERFADKLRDLKEQVKQADERQADKEGRKEMRSRQVDRVEELDQAQRALGADKNSLEKLLEQLENLANQSDQSMSPSQMDQLDQKMQEQMQSDAMQAAREMMQRLQQMLGQAGAPQDQPPEGQQPPQSAPPPPPSTLSEAANATAVVDQIVEELGDFDAGTRTVIIGMQKRQREDLLQSLKSKGPEGYRAFVREYFRKLAKVKGEPTGK